MKRPTSTSKHWRAAAKAISNRLSEQTSPVLMFSLTSLADQAAVAIGRKTDLFESLFDYMELLPSGWTSAWLGQGGAGDSLYHAIPRGWTGGEVETSLAAALMGAGAVSVVASPET